MSTPTQNPPLPPGLVLYQLGVGHYVSRALFLAAKLGLADQLEGDVRFNTDFRRVYATLLEDVLGIESEPVLKQKFDKVDLVRS